MKQLLIGAFLTTFLVGCTAFKTDTIDLPDQPKKAKVERTWVAPLPKEPQIFNANSRSPSCGNLKKSQEYLLKNFGETVRFRGLSSNGYMIMLFANEDTGSFSIGFVMPTNTDVICPADQGKVGIFYPDDFKDTEAY